MAAAHRLVTQPARIRRVGGVTGRILECTFWDKFKPVLNHIAKNRSWDGHMFETFGEELEWVKAQPADRIWTWLDCDGGSVVNSGYSFVNRIGYFVTEMPFTSSLYFKA